VITRPTQREVRPRWGSQRARKRAAARRAFQTRDALLDHRRRRVHDARVRVAVLLQIEIGGGGFGVFKDVARRLEDRHRPRARVRLGPLARVNRARVESELVQRLVVERWVAAVALVGDGHRNLIGIGFLIVRINRTRSGGTDLEQY